MRHAFAVWIVLGVLGGAGGDAAGQGYHEPVYLVSTGRVSTVSNPASPSGLLEIDARGATPRVTTLVAADRSIPALAMDVDNRGIVFATNTLASGGHLVPVSPRGGLFRYDPTTMQITTLFSSTLLFQAPGRVTIDQNGDYVIGASAYLGGQFHSLLYRIDRTGSLTTMLTSLAFGRRLRFQEPVHTDIDTGRLLVTSYDLRGGRDILELSLDGSTVATWARGWNPIRTSPQEHATGDLVSPYYQSVYRLARGGGAATIVAKLPLAPTDIVGEAFPFDLQTAANPRWVGASSHASLSKPSVLLTLDAQSVVIGTAPLSAQGSAFSAFAFRGGRHLQTVRTAARRWDVRISAPSFAGRRYALVASLTGPRPAFALGDGRRVNLAWDALAFLTLVNRIPTVVGQGAGTLNASGEAVGFVDTSAFGAQPLGVPVWLACLVLDPNAPIGVALATDTIVLRV